ncbi:transmembrane amino acid transporter protein-domain-containing protein [Sporodiniella umbellata]|nr:transmembrane amino acid transporter protein-domain-containing protein [Sporodiniella umbellata]
MRTEYGALGSEVESIKQEDREMLMENGPGYGTRSKVESAFNLVNSTVGSGVIGLPFAVYLAGFWNALFLSIGVAAISQFGLYMFIVSAQRTGAYRLATLMEKVIGRPGYHFLNFLVLIQATGACVSYYILMGDTLPVLLQLYFPHHPTLTHRSFVLVCIALFFVLPLNLSRSLGALAHWSILSVLCLPVILVALLIRAPTYAQSHDSPLGWHSPDLFGALGILAFAFSCPHVCFSVYLSQKQQSVQAWHQTTTLASILTWIISFSLALVGYLSFGVDVHPNLFLNFPADDTVVNIARFALGFSMILTIP